MDEKGPKTLGSALVITGMKKDSWTPICLGLNNREKGVA
jgi:hypothetical protein